jgi:uncharacterized protein (TIGR03067 family)
MRRVTILIPCIALVVAASRLVAGAQDDNVEKELKRLEGTWKLISSKLFGKEDDDERDKQAIYILKGNKFIVKMKGGEDDVNTFRIDMTKDPMHFDQESMSGTVKGIYRLKDDTLTLCLPFPFITKNRPTRFESDREGKACLMVFKRQPNP